LINDTVDLGQAQLGFSRLAQQHGLAAHELDRGVPPPCAWPVAAGQAWQASAGNEWGRAARAGRRCGGRFEEEVVLGAHHGGARR
jgi:hypothetical protein